MQGPTVVDAILYIKEMFPSNQPFTPPAPAPSIP